MTDVLHTAHLVCGYGSSWSALAVKLQHSCSMTASEHSASALQVDTMATSSMDMEELPQLPLLLHPQVTLHAAALPFLCALSANTDCSMHICH